MPGGSPLQSQRRIDGAHVARSSLEFCETRGAASDVALLGPGEKIDGGYNNVYDGKRAGIPLPLRNSNQIDARIHLKSGNAEPYAR